MGVVGTPVWDNRRVAINVLQSVYYIASVPNEYIELSVPAPKVGRSPDYIVEWIEGIGDPLDPGPTGSSILLVRHVTRFTSLCYLSSDQ
jgi:hypothetical protein